MSEKPKEDGLSDNVVMLPARNERPLNDDELVRMRVMLRQFEQMTRECPMHRRLLFDEN